MNVYQMLISKPDRVLFGMLTNACFVGGLFSFLSDDHSGLIMTKYEPNKF